MLQYIILALALILGLVLLTVWFIHANPGRVASALKWVGAGLFILMVLVLLFTRRFGLLLYLVGFGLPIWGAWLAARHRAKAMRGATPGQASEVKTRFLRMVLDHDSGEMTGEVLEGRFRGARLEDLDLDQKLELWQECRGADLQSAAVLEAYLDRAHGESWREAARSKFEGAEAPPPGSASGRMSEEEALAILGLESGASKREIIEAHRRLMQKVHPDHGGSNYLASKINEAKDLLISRARRGGD